MARDNLTNALIFGPMEGITDSAYRENILENYPQWDFVFTEFLRAPHQGRFKDSHIINFFGKSLFFNENLKKKTVFQILTSLQSNHIDLVRQLEALGFDWIDLNLGCPSKTVNKHGGGAIILNNPSHLRKILEDIRSNYTGIFSIKIRLGYSDTQLFLSNLEIAKDCGVDLITIHARTRDQLYKGVANWDYLKLAKDHMKDKILIIGNGDIWSPEDITNMKEKTSIHSVMIARGAMKAPWFPLLMNKEKQKRFQIHSNNILPFFNTYKEKIQLNESLLDIFITKRFKAVSRYMFDDFTDGLDIKKKLFRTQNSNDFLSELNKRFS